MCETGVEVLPVMARDYFVDVDKPWHIVEASLAAMRHELSLLERTIIEPGASIDDGANIASDARLWLKRGAHIGRGCHVKGNVILEENAQVTCGGILGKDVMLGRDSKCNEYGAVKSGSVMGRECVVSHCAEFEGVAFDVVYLYHYCCVTALLGCNVDIGAATVCGTWRFDDGKRVHDFGGRKESPECHANKTYIGDYSRTGVNVMFMPGVKVGHYCCVGAGAIVYDDIPDGTLLLPKQEHVTQPWGPERYGW
jgi:bifunctional UDP-N-acetylglucosamine pyrophosphorylase/glucosamine-1-phosphate N-acetyltransferase